LNTTGLIPEMIHTTWGMIFCRQYSYW